MSAPQGNLFPDFSKLAYNETQAGRAFSVLIESCGAGTQKQTVAFDAAAWEAARREPTFDDDYRLSVARLLVQIAVKLYS
jgi:hypothetical protein